MTLTLEIVSPARLLLSKAVDMVVMPGYEGDLAAQPGHAPVITMLRGGVVSLHEGGRVTERFFVAGGFAEITAERCTVLSDEAVAVDGIDAARAKTSLTEAETAWVLVDKLDNDARQAALDNVQIARARVDASAT